MKKTDKVLLSRSKHPRNICAGISNQYITIKTNAYHEQFTSWQPVQAEYVAVKAHDRICGRTSGSRTAPPLSPLR